METLVERAAQSLSHHPSPALPLDELSEHVRHGGHVVGPGVLLRALEARPDLFRVLYPWRGPWRAAAPRPGRTCAAQPPDHALDPPGERWVVPLGRATCDRDARARLKASLVHLGRTLDERSPIEMARWLAMVREMERTLARERAGEERNGLTGR